MSWPGGSSPHTRGLRTPAWARALPRGIIPAHAGFTPSRAGSRPQPADHPRTRGVYRSPTGRPVWHGGSSPHTRGLRRHVIGVTRRRRIIPAHAGFTQGDPRSPPAPADHPRTRGVYALSGARRVGSCGSSPHTRGLRVGVREPAETGRIIPAHAGFTRWTGTIAHTVAGSSPHTRGLRDALTVHAPHMHHPRTRGVYVRASPTCTVTEGIIPAHAGFT